MPNWQAFVEAEQMYRLQQQQQYKTLLQQQHTEQQHGNSIRQNVEAAALQMYLQQQVSYIHTHTYINICKYVNVFSKSIYIYIYVGIYVHTYLHNIYLPTSSYTL